MRAVGVVSELVVVEDCSSDGTRELLQQLPPAPDLKLVFHDRNRGKGAGLRSGFAAATGDIVIIQDADLEYDPREYPKLLQPILEDRADVVYGSRFAGGESHRVLYFWHYLGNRALTLMSNAFTNLNLSDMETCYKVFRREILQQVQVEEDRFGFEPEVTGKVAALRCRIYEVGISYSRPDLRGRQEDRLEGRRPRHLVHPEVPAVAAATPEGALAAGGPTAETERTWVSIRRAPRASPSSAAGRSRRRSTCRRWPRRRRCGSRR